MTTADELEAPGLSVYLIGEHKGSHDLVAARSAEEALRVLCDKCGYGADDVGAVEDVIRLSESDCRSMRMRDEDNAPCGTVWDALLECTVPDWIGGTEL